VIISDEQYILLKRRLLKGEELEANIISESMTPLINKGDKVTFALKEDLKLFDIIIFKYRDSLYCHIYLGESSLNKDHYKTIGLNNDNIDIPISKEDILGVVTNFKINFFHKLRVIFKLRT